MKTSTLSQAMPKAAQEHDATTKKPRATRAGPIYRRILVAVDFSPASAAVFERGLKMAREDAAELLIAHAEVFPRSLSFMPSTCYDKWDAQTKADSKQQIELLVEQARKQGIRCHALALTGLVDDAVLHAAQKLKADLIILGTHGHKGVSGLFSGSVAKRIHSHAPCSVLTVRLPER